MKQQSIDTAFLLLGYHASELRLAYCHYTFSIADVFRLVPIQLEQVSWQNLV